MKQLFTLFLLAITTATIHSQTVLIDFESSTTWTDFDGGVMTTASNPNSTGNSSGNVGKMVKNAGETWGGSSTILSTGLDFSTENSISLDVFSPRAGATITFKLEESTTPANNTQVVKSISAADTWETLYFDFASSNTAHSYDKIVIIFDNGTAGDGTANYTFYVDNITQLSYSAPVPAPTTSAPTPPSRDAENVSSIFSPDYADHQFDEYQPGWGIGTLTDFFIGDDKMWKVDGFEKFAVADYTVPQFDIDDMEKFHVDIWTEGDVSTGDKIKLQLVSAAGAGAGNDVMIEDVVTVAGGGTWQTVEFDLTTIKGTKDWSQIIQVILLLSTKNHEVYYFDNMYFSKEPTVAGADATLSDLAIDGTSLSGFSGAATNYSVPLTDGTTNIPQITLATPTDGNANVVITQATSIPGDATVVVTAADGTTSKTYTFSFYIGKPAAGPTSPTHDATNVISIYSDAYTSVATNYNPNWSQATGVNTTYDAGDSNNLLLYSNFNYQGTELTETDLTSMDFLHIDIWVAENETRAIKVSLIGGGETFVRVTTTPGSWNSVDIPLTSFSSNDLSIISQMKFDGQFASDGLAADTTIRSDVYLDNIYFYKGTTASIDDVNSNFNIYPNPVKNTLNVSAGVMVDQVSIFDLTGRQVLRATPKAESFSLDVSNLNKGMYLVSVKAGEQELTTKLVK